MTPIFYILAGLPGSGKSAIARTICRRLNAVYLRIDTIEQALRDLCDVNVQGEGYRLAYRVVADNLRLGSNVIADSCNPITLPREECEDVARKENAEFVNIEVVCSDEAEHRLRVEQRDVEVPGLTLPTWQEVLDREYHSWKSERIVIETSGKSVEQSCKELLNMLQSKDLPS